ncbi:MAG: glucosidase [Rhodothermales bacterium]
MPLPDTAEHRRLADSEARRADWKNWGPYVSDRAWGTVREDYSPHGEAWEYLPHDHARSRAYRWNEDALGGFCNRFQNVCLGVALWNERDAILKERLYGLTGNEGNHGEDVKEYYFYLDGTPTHSYMRMLYKYPQVAFPYGELIAENRRRGRDDPEFELIDALRDTFEAGRYFDVDVEYAKVDEEDILCRIVATNRGPEAAPIHLLPHLWYRNTWSWESGRSKPTLRDASTKSAVAVRGAHRHLGERWWYVEADGGADVDLLFTENETNAERLFGLGNPSPYVKDGIHEAIVGGRSEAVNPEGEGTKVAAHARAVVAPGASFEVRVRYTNKKQRRPFAGFEKTFKQRIDEADAFHATLQTPVLSEDERRVQRQAFAGILWTKQFYHYSVELWLKGDPAQPAPPDSRTRNADWGHLYNLDVLSMPDKWEYPWFAAWDLAFHMIPTAMVDPEWAKRQLILMLREWYMHPNGQIPAYEWAFGDVNPPVHAWAALRVYKIDRNLRGKADTVFLEKVFHKLLLNFTWWVNRKDHGGNNIFQGGFLGLDNIGVFDRSAPLPGGGRIEQADGTAWMGMYCLNMLAIALELARTEPAYEDVATKFFEHFIAIANAINRGCGGRGLWNEEEGFYYDILSLPDGRQFPMKVDSLVGLIPLFAVETLEPDVLEKLPHFRRRMDWFIKYRPDLIEPIASLTEPGEGGRLLLSLVDRSKLERVLRRMLDPDAFLADYGLRGLSKRHETDPYSLHIGGETYSVSYEPAESTTGLFGGNSNWRGPIWFPVNHLMVESLQKYDHYYGESLKVEHPVGSGQFMPLDDVATDLSRRLVRLFLRDDDGRRPVYGGEDLFQHDEHWRDHVLFYEYFHGDNGAGLGASHQTGWTALVAKLIQQSGGMAPTNGRAAAAAAKKQKASS